MAAGINSRLPLLLLFFLPLSTSVISVLAVLVLILWLVEGNFADKFSEIFSNPVVLSVLAFLSLLLLGLLWSPDVDAGLEIIAARWKIAMLPVFLTVTSRQRVSLYCYAFLAGLTLAMGLTYLSWFGLLQYADVSPVHLTRKTFHVVYNPLLAFGIYLTLHQALWNVRKPALRTGLFVLAGLMVVNMFLTEGRAGQLVFFVLMALLLLQVFHRNRLRAVLVIVVLLPSLFMAGYTLSPVFRQRVDAARTEIRQFRHNPDTSVGMRLLYWRNSWEIIRRHPWYGVGTGGFEAAYAQVNSEKSPLSFTTDNPHNQYVLVTTMLGLPGLAALLLIFAVMFHQAFVIRDRWQRVRLAFPLFFLTIMVTESYLKVYETGFFFTVFAAVLYGRISRKVRELRLSGQPCWLILSYRANIEGSACSQHLDDRLPCLRARGIEPILLSGPVGPRSSAWIHFQIHSLAPSGIRFEVRHFLRRHLHRRWQFKIVETILLLPVFPFYLLEKIIINLESEWSWWVLASLRGAWLCRQLRPRVIYSTGGSASAHVAAMLIGKWTGTCWLAETQDPLVHDHDWQRSTTVLHLYRWLEKKICLHADRFIFLVRAAMEHTDLRVGGECRGAVIYPGSVPDFFKKDVYAKGSKCHFAHFGSLAGTRNLAVFFAALRRVLDRDPAAENLLQVDVYGSFDRISEQAMEEYALENLVVRHGPVARKEALGAMQRTDCLLLIQNIIYFSCETIPSKVYEYLLSGRPVLAMLYNNPELAAMLNHEPHLVAAADSVRETARAIALMLKRFRETDFTSVEGEGLWTVDRAVRNLVQLADQCPKKSR